MNPATPLFHGLLGLILLAGLSAPLRAEVVREPMPSGRTAEAEYRPGEAGRPAVLILHGFLTTRNFNTVLSLVEALSENGNAVLAPTLTLGISARRGSLACDAIHTHTMDQDLDEIDAWVKWLARRHRGPIVLVGHSYGSLELLAWLATRPHPRVRMLITTSLSYADGFNPPEVVRRQVAEARQAVRRGDQRPRRFTLSYCQDNFIAPPRVYLSYLQWNAERVLAALQQAPVPVEVIMGGNDRRFDRRWRNALRRAGARLEIIDGANHFFDAEHEFELHDAVIARVESVSR